MTLFKKFTTWVGKTATDAVQKATDAALVAIEAPLNTVGLGNVIPDSAYSSKASAAAANMTFNIKSTVDNSILNAVSPGTGTITKQLQTFNSSSVIPNPGAKYDYPIDNSGQILQQKLLDDQLQKQILAKQEEALRAEKLKSFIPVAVIIVLGIVLVVVFMDD